MVPPSFEEQIDNGMLKLKTNKQIMDEITKPDEDGELRSNWNKDNFYVKTPKHKKWFDDLKKFDLDVRRRKAKAKEVRDMMIDKVILGSNEEALQALKKAKELKI